MKDKTINLKNGGSIMDDDAMDTLCTTIFLIVVVGGYTLFKYFMYKLWVRNLYKKHNMGGRNNKNSMTWKKASKIFGIRMSKLKKMSKIEVKKVYRMRAKKDHPDHGGSDKKFNDLNEAYQFAYAA